MSSPEIPSIADTNARYRVGTLQYTKAGLAWVFLMLLWGDFVFQLMESVAPSIVPLRLKQLGISDFLLPIVTATIPNIINTMLNPVISTASDRYRGRFGRRIPFMLFSAPFICGALVLLAFSTEIGVWLHGRIGPMTGWSAGAVAILAMSVLWIMFTVLNMFATTVYYYFFNDVVPGMFMSRFFGLFRLVSSLAAVLWNYLIYQHALTHMKLIFLGAALVYFIGFLTMCLGIKEGKYPPAPAMGEGFWTKLRIYAKECLSHRLYIYMFVHNIFWSVSSACGTYTVFLSLSLGLTLKQIGSIAAAVNLVQMFLSYPAGMLADRFHPMRVMVWIKIGLVAIVPLNFVWLFGNFQPQTAFHILIALAAVELPLGLLYDTTRQPMQMLVWPKSRYGQFCSFNAIVQAACGIVATVAAGLYMTAMRRAFPDAKWGTDYCYRMIPAWRLPFLCAALVFLLLMYREWKRLGGLKNYKVPGFADEAAMEDAPAK
ncbi:MAG: MFS transporter [Candidatus Brocadiia bacterium]